jgi:hypothetical protein
MVFIETKKGLHPLTMVLWLILMLSEMLQVVLLYINKIIYTHRVDFHNIWKMFFKKYLNVRYKNLTFKNT